MTPVVFHPEAVAELREQASFYEEQAPGLGKRFLSSVEAAVALAASMPRIGSPGPLGTRRVFPRNFPHAIVYREADDGLTILAVAPFRRQPRYWGRRG